MKTALVLGGGGARGLAHVGVLKVLEQEQIIPDMIIGCSSGAIIGGMYAQTPDAEAIEKRLHEFFASKEYEDLSVAVIERHTKNKAEDDFLQHLTRNLKRRILLNMVASRQAILKDNQLGRAVDFLISDGDITQTAIPFACNATDLVTGQPALFKEGDIRAAIKASGTIPGYLPPVRIGSKILVDGAVTYNLPVMLARKMGADRVIAVDLKQNIKIQDDFINVFDIILRSALITSTTLSREICERADFIIKPEVGDFMWYEFKQMDKIIAAGEKAARASISAIKKNRGQSKEGFFKKLFRSGKSRAA